MERYTDGLMWALVKEKPEQGLCEEAEHYERYSGNDGAGPKLEAQNVPHTVRIALSCVLRAEDAGARKSAENGQVENKDKLICYCNAAHLLRAEPAHHYIVKNRNKLSDAVLNHDRYHYCEHCPIESAGAYKFS